MKHRRYINYARSLRFSGFRRGLVRLNNGRWYMYNGRRLRKLR